MPLGTQEDVDMAVDAASKAFESWSKLPGHVRARHMYSIARHVQKHARYVYMYHTYAHIMRPPIWAIWVCAYSVGPVSGYIYQYDL